MNPVVYTTGPTKKHPAFILAVDASYFSNPMCVRPNDTEPTPVFRDPINHYAHELFLQEVQSHLVIREREYLDNGQTTHETRRSADGKFKKGNPAYKQILPYLVAQQLQEDGTTLFFPYRRTSGVGESRLAGNGSVGYGGHVDLVDVVMDENLVRPTSLDNHINDSEVPVTYNSVINLRKTIILSLMREANEEFTVLSPGGLSVMVEEDWFKFGNLFILDNSNDVGELHLGLIMVLTIPTGFTLIATEDELAKLPAMSAVQMLADPLFKPENWTRIYLEHFMKTAPLDTVGIDHGGEQVGLVDPHFLATEMSALELGAHERTAIHIQVPKGEDPFPHIEEAVRGHFGGAFKTVEEDGRNPVSGSVKDAINKGRGGEFAPEGATDPASVAQNQAAAAYHHYRESSDMGSRVEEPARFISPTVTAKIGDVTLPLEVTQAEEDRFRLMAEGKTAVIPSHPANIAVTAEEDDHFRFMDDNHGNVNQAKGSSRMDTDS